MSDVSWDHLKQVEQNLKLPNVNTWDTTGTHHPGCCVFIWLNGPARTAARYARSHERLCLDPS